MELLQWQVPFEMDLKHSLKHIHLERHIHRSLCRASRVGEVSVCNVVSYGPLCFSLFPRIPPTRQQQKIDGHSTYMNLPENPTRIQHIKTLQIIVYK